MPAETPERIISLFIAFVVFAAVWYYLSLRRLKKQGEDTEENIAAVRQKALKNAVIFSAFYMVFQLF